MDDKVLSHKQKCLVSIVLVIAGMSILVIAKIDVRRKDVTWILSQFSLDSYQNSRSAFKFQTAESVEKKTSNHSYLILVWTPFFGNWQYGMSPSAWKPLHTSFCHYEICTVTNNRSLLKQADALVFHCRDSQPWPTVRYTHQIWVLYCLESPNHSNFARFNNRINATATDRRDSDIFVPYHDIRPTNRSDIKPYSPRVPWSSKTRGVAWAASHCITKSKREQYIRELGKYINVDKFGHCGNLKCKRGERCNRRMEKEYKFYLSFENSVCIDYVTEKFFITANYELIPVVLGGANYSKHMPPKSFIDVRDFRSPKQLAERLRSMSAEEYYEYFKWKPFYENKPASHDKLFCGVCELLRNGSYFKTYGNIQAWYRTPPCDDNLVSRILG